MKNEQVTLLWNAVDIGGFVILFTRTLLLLAMLSLRRDEWQTDRLRLFLYGAHINRWVNVRGFKELILAEAFVKAPVSIGYVYIH